MGELLVDADQASDLPTDSGRNGHDVSVEGSPKKEQPLEGSPKASEHSSAIKQLGAAVLKRCRTRIEGDKIFDKLRGEQSQEVFADLGVTPCDSACIDKAYNKCKVGWEELEKADARFLIKRVLQDCESLMQIDEKFRNLQKKMGRKMDNGGVLTEKALKTARSQCQAYWSKITPGNVSLIQNNIAGKCTNWEDASKKFEWLWKNGIWAEDGKTVVVKGREFSLEDLEQGERNCRRKFNLPGSSYKPRTIPKASAKAPTAATVEVSKRTEDSKPPVTEASAQSVAVAEVAATGDVVDKPMPSEAEDAALANVAAQVAALALAGSVAPQEQEEDDENEELPTASEEAPAKATEAPPESEKVAPETVPEAETDAKKRKAPAVSNADYIMDHILKKCNDAQSAQKFFKWLRDNPTQQMRGRIFLPEEVDEAEKRCQHVWEKDKQKEAEEAAKQKAELLENMTNVELIVSKVLSKADSMEKSEKYFEMLNKTAGKSNPLGRIFTAEEITQAWLECQEKFEAQEASKSSSQKRKAEKMKQVSGVDTIVRYVLRKCDDMGHAQKLFDMLEQSAGEMTVLGRSFEVGEITEAFFKVQEFFEENADSSSSGSGSDASSGSDSSEILERRSKVKSGAKTDKPEKKKKKKKKKGKKNALANELEEALFGDDSDDSLSGEEAVDEEDEFAGEALLADLGLREGDEPEIMDDGYPADAWEGETKDVLPGYEGFNKRATLVMQKHKVGAQRLQVQLDVQAACPPLQPHQEATAFLLHPKSPVSRMLVDHPTGSGKTREMIKVLDNHFYDVRAKVPIFPKDPVCRNFYVELLRWPSRYRDYFCCMSPADAAVACGLPNWKEVRFHMWDLSGFREEELRRICYQLREVLEMKGMFYKGQIRRSCRIEFHKKNPGESMPMAPLRALGYTSAGGSFSQVLADRPQSSLMKIGYEIGSGNVYCNKVVLMDEAHNLVRTQTQYAEQLHRLRDLLFTAKNLVLCGFTGTPILNEPTEGRQLLDIIKGCNAPEGDEGYLSSFPMRPQPLFPLSLPRGIPDAILTVQRKRQLISKVEIHGETLKTYDFKRRLGLPGRRLRAYCNMSTYHGSFHEGKNGTKVKVLTFPEENAPKLYAIAQEVCASQEKAIIMTSRMSGYIVMLELMRFMAGKQETPFGVATMDELSEFNHVSNIRGEIFRVMVADAATCSEGVSFLAVRRTYIADVPISPSQFIQQCGRSIRMYGHRGLRDDEQTVTTKLFVSVFPKWLKTSLANWALRAQKKVTLGKEFEKKARILTAKLHRAGFKSLAALKERIDAHGLAKQQSQGLERTEKVALTSDDVIGFLEQNGLWEEARLIKEQERREKEKAEAKTIEHMKPTISKAASLESMGSELPPGASLESMGSVLPVGESLESIDTCAGSPPEGSPERSPDGSQDLARMDSMEEDLGKALEEAMEEQGIEADEDEPGFEGDERDELMEGDDALEGDEGLGREKRRKIPKQSPVKMSPVKMSPDPSATTEPGVEPTISADPSQSDTPMVDAPPETSSAAAGSPPPAEGAATNGTNDNAPAPPAPPAPPPPVDPEEALAKASERRSTLGKSIVVVRDVCEELTKAAKAKAAEPLFDKDTGAPLPPPKIDFDAWRVKLEDGLQELRKLPIIKEACKIAVHVEFDSERQSLKTLTAAQVRALRAELIRLEKTEIMSYAVAAVNIASRDIENAGTEVTQEWRTKLESTLADIRTNEDFVNALKIAAPSLVGEGAAIEEWHKVSFTGLTSENINVLQTELTKTKMIKEVVQSKPRALVRAMQALYQAESLEEAELSLLPETADEEAVRQLTERSQEFAPALTAMRQVAVDHEVFRHLADQIDEEGDAEDLPESEGSDLEKELVGKRESGAVVLPAGWRLEWVKRKKREVREFVDPAGNRYLNVREVRQAIEDWENRGGDDSGGQTLDNYNAPSASDAFGWDTIEEGMDQLKRRRLRGKTAAQECRIEEPTLDIEALAEEAFGDMLDSLTTETTPAPVAETPADKAVNSNSGTVARPTARPGIRVVLHSLQAKPELNGKFARLKSFLEDSGRWELILEPGASCDRANVKPANFTILPAVQQDSAPALRPNRRLTGKTSVPMTNVKRSAPTATGAKPAKSKRGGAAAVVTAEDEESD